MCLGLWALKRKTKDKPNGIYMEPYLFADIKLHVHLSLFFTFFVLDTVTFLDS